MAVIAIAFGFLIIEFIESNAIRVIAAMVVFIAYFVIRHFGVRV